MTVENYRNNRTFIASILAKLDASVESNSNILSGEELDTAFEKEVHVEYDMLLDSVKDLVGVPFIEQRFGSQVSGEALAKAERSAADKAQRQAKE